VLPFDLEGLGDVILALASGDVSRERLEVGGDVTRAERLMFGGDDKRLDTDRLAVLEVSLRVCNGAVDDREDRGGDINLLAETGLRVGVMSASDAFLGASPDPKAGRLFSAEAGREREALTGGPSKDSPLARLPIGLLETALPIRSELDLVDNDARDGSPAVRGLELPNPPGVLPSGDVTLVDLA
jgi:hypothetical protein